VFAGGARTGCSDAAVTVDDATLLRKSAKRLLTGTELFSIGLEPYRAQSVVVFKLFITSDSVVIC